MIEDLKFKSYNEIKEFVDGIKEKQFHDDIFVEEISNFLKEDKRKNVNKLGERLNNSINKYNKEVERVKKMYSFDLSFGKFDVIAGIDEVGRGPLAGPIVAAAVVLKNDISDLDEVILGLNDSKKIQADKREYLSDIIIESAESYNIALWDNIGIDEKGIAFCNNDIFIQAFKGLSVSPKLVLTDGYPIRGYTVNNVAVIKGDTKSASIAAASIIAKVYRDKLMKEYSKLYPEYGFDKNVGYGTKEHIEAIKKYGITPIHRKSFLKSILGEE
ncbi:ribonuclease HII [Clostridium sp. 19966]|uniref:ribonuclease HII n=1 Tax=Clostridium sp. 19966 TaxID=2768166 RepID=UPI0028DFAB23|nr:ribonuclease HII [Clostridium sp. 19966]MDT8716439.1 ribonuclease HII [Clostridium sp. 19966]